MDDNQHSLAQGVAAGGGCGVAWHGPILPVADEFFRPGAFSEIPLPLLHERVIGRLSDFMAAAIGLHSPVREVRVSAEVQRHIFEQRQVASVDDVMVCLNRLEEAFANLTFLIVKANGPSVFETIGALPAASRYLQLPMKLVPGANSKSAGDELWLRTAYPCGTRTLLRYRRQRKLQLLLTGDPCNALAI